MASYQHMSGSHLIQPRLRRCVVRSGEMSHGAVHAPREVGARAGPF